jgi:hypothetical protein
MSETNKTTDAPAKDRDTAEAWVERIATYWGRAAVAAWRTVFPRREDSR